MIQQERDISLLWCIRNLATAHTALHIVEDLKNSLMQKAKFSLPDDQMLVMKRSNINNSARVELKYFNSPLALIRAFALHPAIRNLTIAMPFYIPSVVFFILCTCILLCCTATADHSCCIQDTCPLPVCLPAPLASQEAERQQSMKITLVAYRISQQQKPFTKTTKHQPFSSIPPCQQSTTWTYPCTPGCFIPPLE